MLTRLVLNVSEHGFVIVLTHPFAPPEEGIKPSPLLRGD